MNKINDDKRNVIFISKATPGDDEFVLWLAPKLEAAGYSVFADILNLETGERWRKTLTETLQNRSVKMLLCCSNETLQRQGVLEEIDIADELSKNLNDEKFIMPLRLKPFKKVFGIAGLNYCNFEPSWADGLEKLLKDLTKQNVPKATEGEIRPQWEQYKRRKQVTLLPTPETLTSNWLRLMECPDNLYYLEVSGPYTHSALRKKIPSFRYPAVPFMRGVLTFCEPQDLLNHFDSVGKFKITTVMKVSDFIENGIDKHHVKSRDAQNMFISLLRQAWEKFCMEEGFLGHTFSNGYAFHVGDNKIGMRKYVNWGRQGEKRRAMLRSISKGRVWEYGVSVIPSLFPYPHLKLKSRVLFSDITEQKKVIVIPEKDKQHRLRRTVCSGWRNKQWHGRLMAFMELLVGENASVNMPLSPRQSLIADASPIMFTSPVSTEIKDVADDDSEELDQSTIGFIPTDGAI